MRFGRPPVVVGLGALVPGIGECLQQRVERIEVARDGYIKRRLNPVASGNDSPPWLQKKCRAPQCPEKPVDGPWRSRPKRLQTARHLR